MGRPALDQRANVVQIVTQSVRLRRHARTAQQFQQTLHDAAVSRVTINVMRAHCNVNHVLRPLRAHTHTETHTTHAPTMQRDLCGMNGPSPAGHAR